jgi:hypothetical protein
MYVVVGRTMLDPHEVEELRLSIADRVTAVSRVKKAAEKANMENTVEDADSIIVVCKRLKLLFDPSDHQKEETRRTQQELPFTGRPSQSVDDAMKEAEREAKRLARHREIVRAVGGILPNACKGFPDDGVLREELMHAFERVEHVDREGDPGEKRWPGIYKLETEDERVVWCAVSTEGGVERYWHDIDPELTKFNPEALAPTLTGDALVPILREAWGLPDPAVREEELRATVAELMQGFELSDDDRAVMAEDDDAFGNLVAEHIDRVTEKHPTEDDSDLPVGIVRRKEAAGREVLLYVVGGVGIELFYDVPEAGPADGTLPDLNEDAFLAIARSILFPAEPTGAAAADETPEQWAKRIRPAPEPDPKKQIMTEMVVQMLHSILLLETPGAVDAWFEFRQAPRTDDELLQQVTDYLVVRTQGKNKLSGTEMIGVKSNADKLQPISYDLTVDPFRVVLGKGKGKKPIDGDSLLVLIRALFDIERPEEQSAEAGADVQAQEPIEEAAAV